VGGEEFAIILTNIPHQNAQSILESIRQKIAGNGVLLADDTVVNVTLSIGATQLAIDDEFNTAYKKADIALYQSKKQGRNMITWYLN